MLQRLGRLASADESNTSINAVTCLVEVIDPRGGVTSCIKLKLRPGTTVCELEREAMERARLPHGKSPLVACERISMFDTEFNAEVDVHGGDLVEDRQKYKLHLSPMVEGVDERASTPRAQPP